LIKHKDLFEEIGLVAAKCNK